MMSDMFEVPREGSTSKTAAPVPDDDATEKETHLFISVLLRTVKTTETLSLSGGQRMQAANAAESPIEDELEGDQQDTESLEQYGTQLLKIADDLYNDYTSRKEQSENIAKAKKYEDFASTVSIAIGNDPSVQKVALFLALTRDAIRAVATPESRVDVINWTTRFYRANMAPWLAQNNGLVSYLTD